MYIEWEKKIQLLHDKHVYTNCITRIGTTGYIWIKMKSPQKIKHKPIIFIIKNCFPIHQNILTYYRTYLHVFTYTEVSVGMVKCINF